jgi:hypothetical protein
MTPSCVKPFGVGFMGIELVLSSASWGPYSYKPLPPLWTLPYM